MAISCSDVLPFSSTVQTAGCAPRANGGGFGYHFRRVDGTGRTCNVLSAVSPYLDAAYGLLTLTCSA